MTAYDASTRVSELPFADPYMIIEEAFAIPVWQGGQRPAASRPQTLAAVAQATGRTLAAVINRLEEIAMLAADIDISPAELDGLLRGDGAKPLLLDVREPWEFAFCHLPDSVLLASLSLEKLLAELKASPRDVVTICHHGIRSTSAALFLREKGVACVRSLKGGVEFWATTIDKNMPRY